MSNEPRILRSVDTPAPERAESSQRRARRSWLSQTLIMRARERDEAAWQRLYQESFDGLFRHVRYLCGDAALAEELTQEAFVQALAKIDRFDGRSTFTTWLHAIALNVVRNHWRSQKSTAKAHAKLAVVRAIEGPAAAPDGAVLQRQRSEALYAALDTLPENLREVFVLRDMQGLPRDEVAEQLGISPGNVSVRGNRARARIREALERMGALAPKEART